MAQFDRPPFGGYRFPEDAYPRGYGGPRVYSGPGGPIMPVVPPPPPRYAPPIGGGDMPLPNYAPPPRYYQEYRRFRDCPPYAGRC